MTFDRFDKLLANIYARSRESLATKSAEYARGGDKLHNFKAAAKKRDCTPLQALQGMLVKHEVSIDDMVKAMAAGGPPPTQAWLDEKMKDVTNYTHLMEALFVEAMEAHEQPGEQPCLTATKTS